jgi:hypothetical protein
MFCDDRRSPAGSDQREINDARYSHLLALGARAIKDRRAGRTEQNAMVARRKGTRPCRAEIEMTV